MDFKASKAFRIGLIFILIASFGCLGLGVPWAIETEFDETVPLVILIFGAVGLTFILVLGRIERKRLGTKKPSFDVKHHLQKHIVRDGIRLFVFLVLSAGDFFANVELWIHIAFFAVLLLTYGSLVYVGWRKREKEIREWEKEHPRIPIDLNSLLPHDEEPPPGKNR